MGFRTTRAGFGKASMVALLMAVLALSATGSRGEDQDLIFSAYYCNVSEVKQLLAQGARVNARDKNNITALMAASLAGHGKVVEFLLARGAEVNVKDKNGKTALMFATRRNYPEVRELLLKAGAK